MLRGLISHFAKREISPRFTISSFHTDKLHVVRQRRVLPVAALQTLDLDDVTLSGLHSYFFRFEDQAQWHAEAVRVHRARCNLQRIAGLLAFFVRRIDLWLDALAGRRVLARIQRHAP